MEKGPIRVMRRKKNAQKDEYVTCEAQLSKDKRTFIVRVESGRPMSWYEAHQAAKVYTCDVVEEAHDVTSEHSH